MIYNVLTVAGTDPSGGAGISADLKTLSALGAYGTVVITAVVAQNTHGVDAVHQLSGEVVSQQTADPVRRRPHRRPGRGEQRLLDRVLGGGETLHLIDDRLRDTA